MLQEEAMKILHQAGVELIVRFGAGTDNIDLAAACKHGILVENTPGRNSTAVAEKTILCAMALCHKVNLAISGFAAVAAVRKFYQLADEMIIDPHTQEILQGIADELVSQLTVNKADCVGTELYGKTIGVIGYCGWIGSKVVTRALDLGMNVLGYDVIRGREIEGAKRVSLPELFACSDFITVHVPLISATRNLIGREQIAQFKNGAFLLNLARAGLVDVDAVFADMSSDRPTLAGFASDVDDGKHRVFELANTIYLPLIAASTIESEARCAGMGADQVVAWLKSGDLINGVNFPDNSLGGQRLGGQLTIVHFDKQGLIKQLSGYFSELDINIGPFRTVPNQQGFACTMIGPDEFIDNQVVADFSKLDGVIRVMVL
jgi:D-3-phosphoglycerate dehydrogenase